MGVQMMLVMLKLGCSEKPGKGNESLLGLERLAVKDLILIKQEESLRSEWELGINQSRISVLGCTYWFHSLEC